MNEHEYYDNGCLETATAPVYNNFGTGDLVSWAADDDISIVTEVLLDTGAHERYYIQWSVDTRASGWHGAHKSLILLNSVRVAQASP